MAVVSWRGCKAVDVQDQPSLPLKSPLHDVLSVFRQLHFFKFSHLVQSSSY